MGKSPPQGLNFARFQYQIDRAGKPVMRASFRQRDHVCERCSLVQIFG